MVGAVLLLGLAAGAAQAAKPAKVTIKLSKDLTSIEGKVKSKLPKCRRNREIKLQTKERGFFRKESETNRKGRYSIGGPGADFGQPMPPAHYFVSAFRKGRKCPFAKSKVLAVE